MGFFDFLDDKEEGKGASKSITVTTSHFEKAVETASKKLQLPAEQIDFKLSKIETLIKRPESNEYEPISSEHINLLKAEESLLSPDLLFKQNYTLVFEKKQTHRYNLKAHLETNSAHSMAKAKILRSSVFPIGEDLKKWLVYELNRFKLRHGIMLSIFEWNMKKEIDMLVDYLNKHGELEKDIEISLSRWPVPAKRTIDDNLIFHYEKGHDESQQRVNHAERNYANFITNGTLLIEYVKPQPGITGREFSGKLIEAHEPIVKHEVMFNADPATIETKENELGIKFYAKKDGYVMMEGGLLKIADQLQVNSIDLKSTGHIKSNMDKDISIHIKGDASEDKIGPNMKVEVANLNIGGSVAEGAEIRSKNLVIGGQTHLTSKIYSEKAEIKVHKGYLEAKNAIILTIENGKVNAENIMATTAIGAEIHAKKVTIKEIKAHCTIEFSHELTIEAVTGNENKFILTPFAQEEEGKKIENAISTLSEKKLDLVRLDKKHEQLSLSVKKNQPAFEELSEAIKEAKSRNQDPSPMILKRFTDLASEKKLLERLKEKSTQIEAEIGELEELIQLTQDKLFQAVITIKTPWKGYNEVYFQMISPKKMIKYLPKEHAGPEQIAIGLDEEGNYEVKRRLYRADESFPETPAKTKPASEEKKPQTETEKPSEEKPVPENTEVVDERESTASEETHKETADAADNAQASSAVESETDEADPVTETTEKDTEGTEENPQN